MIIYKIFEKVTIIVNERICKAIRARMMMAHQQYGGIIMSKIKEFNELYLAKKRLFIGNVPSRNGNRLMLR